MSGTAVSVMLMCEGLQLAGGVERFVCELANHLAQQGLAVSIATLETRREDVRYPLSPAVRLLSGAPSRARAEAAPGAWRILRRQWRLGRTLGRIARRERPDVIVLNGLTTACSVLALSPGLAARAVCCDHNHFDARSAPWRRLRARCYPKVAAVVSLTEADAPRFRALNPRTQVIHNASSLRADTPALPQAPIVLAVGRLVAQKGIDLLLQAWPAVLAAVPAARLRIVAEGPLAAALRRQAADAGIEASVDWRPPTERIEREYREAAVFVLPSRYEGMPLALLEAQALGVPAVAFDCPTGPREILGDEGGLLVPPGDVAGLAGALVALLQAPEERARMARAAIERQQRLFGRQAHFERWTGLLRDVAGRQRTRAPA